jgi:hypothetical protein
MTTMTPTTPAASRRDFDVELSRRSPGITLAHKIGSKMWLPMFALALTAFPAALVVGSVRAGKIADRAGADTIAVLQNVTAGLMFIGFASVLAAISFAIVRILGRFREGGGDVQEAVGQTIQTLKMPLTAKAFLAIMFAATTTLAVAVVLHFVFAVQVHDNPASLELADDRFVVLEGIKRIGVAMDLFAIILGLATIVRVLRFQAVRVRELAQGSPRSD